MSVSSQPGRQRLRHHQTPFGVALAMQTGTAPNPSPDEIAAALSEDSAWATDTQSVEWIQTHISHVFLRGDRVYKLRKSVRLPFLDFGSRRTRNEDCLHEVELNRRLAPSVYLGIAPVIVKGSAIHVGPIADGLADPDLEHVVVMRRLTAGRDALSLLERGILEPRHVEATALLVERFHAGQSLGTPAPWVTEDWHERIAEPILSSLLSLGESNLISGARIQAIESRIRERLASLRPHFEQRRLEGRAVDGHGDLHLDHVWFEDDDADPLLIDCLEFNEDLRRIDSASEVAFLAMDFRYRKRIDLAEWFLGVYARQADDYGLFSVVDVYTAYRALVRAKVAALAALQQSISEAQRASAGISAEDHFALAESLLETNASSEIIVLCGTVGSGKSSVANHLAQSCGGISIASDRVRKAMAGISATTHSATDVDQGLYHPEQTERVYRALLDRAAPVLATGRKAILDASFTKRSQRDAVRAWAAERDVPVRLIEVRCDADVARDRLATRARIGTDPSDAGPSFLPTSEARFEPPDEWPQADHRIVWTSDEDWRGALAPMPKPAS